jgi:hypothetical protein
MYYYLYQITNLLNEKVYVGVHRTDNLDDGYMGSGTLLKRAQSRYGLENFKKEILEYFENEEDMFQREAEIVNPEFAAREDVYNLVEGGKGFSTVSSVKATRAREKLRELDEEFRLRYAKALSNSHPGISLEKQKKMIEAKRNLLTGAAHDPEMRAEMFRRSQTPEARARHRAAVQGIGKGERNSQFGTMWITNEKENKKIKKDEPIPEGWRRGRSLKKK